MTLPILTKTWQFQVNTATSGAADPAYAQSVMLAISNGMRGIGPWTDSAGAGVSPTNNWTVQGTSDAVTAVMNGSNPWSALADIVWSAGNHSWQIFRQTALGGNAEILIDLDDSAVSDLFVIMSPSLGFGAANGGTDGTISARPTALDEVVVIDNTDSWGLTSTDQVHRLHVASSADGLVTRIYICRAGHATGYWDFTAPGDASVGWDAPWVAIINGNDTATPATRAITLDNFVQFERGVARHSGTNFNLFLTVTNFQLLRIPETQVVTNGISNDYPALPIHVYSNTVNRVGTHGFLPDQWWVQESLAEGSTFPNDASNQFANLGPFIQAWNGTIPLLA